MWMTAESLVALEAERDVLEKNESQLSQDERVRLLAVRRSIQEADVSAKPNDGVAEDGMLVTVVFADGERETFVLSDGLIGDDVSTVSAESPIGRALIGRRVGDTVRYAAPSGAELQITIEAATPYSPRR